MNKIDKKRIIELLKLFRCLNVRVSTFEDGIVSDE